MHSTSCFIHVCLLGCIQMPLTTRVYLCVITHASQGRSVLGLPFVHLHCIYCTTSSYNKIPACSFKWPHSTLAGYTSSSQAKVLYPGTLSMARMVSTWGTFTSAPSSAPLTYNTFPWTTCGSLSWRVCLCPLWLRAPSSSVG